MKQNNMKETILSAATDLIIKQGVKKIANTMILKRQQKKEKKEELERRKDI